MKNKHILNKYKLILLGILILFVFGCVQKHTAANNMKTDGIISDGKMNSGEDLEFKKMCQNAGWEWMLMKPTKDGKIIMDAKSCMGCMVEGIEHICDKGKFLDIIGVK